MVEDDVNDESIKLRWRQPLFPNGEITNYQVIYRTSAETQENVKYHYQAVLDGEVQETTVHGLVPGTEYVFEVSPTDLKAIVNVLTIFFSLLPSPVKDEQLHCITQSSDHRLFV